MCKVNTIRSIISTCAGFITGLAQGSRYCVTTISCHIPPWRWPAFCLNISYITSQPKGQTLKEDEMVCDFLPPTTVTVLQTCTYTHTHTHAVLNLAHLREAPDPLPFLKKCNKKKTKRP